jgi:hypothetical protein
VEFEKARAQLAQLRRYPRNVIQRGGRTRPRLCPEVAKALVRARHPTGQGLVQDDACRIPIGSRLRILTHGLLGCHVRDRPGDVRGPCVLEAQRQPKVEEHQPPALGHEDVLRLDVAMDQTGGVQRHEATRQLAQAMLEPADVQHSVVSLAAPQARGALSRDRYARGGSELSASAGPDVVQKSLPLHHLHGEVELASLFEQAAKTHQVWM